MWLEHFFNSFFTPEQLAADKVPHLETLKTDPTNQHALDQLSVIATSEGNRKDSYRYGYMLLENYRTYCQISDVYFGWGRLELMHQNFKKAIFWYQKSIVHEPHNMREEAYYEMGACYSHLKKYKKAEKCFLIAIDYFEKEYFGPLLPVTTNKVNPSSEKTIFYWEDLAYLYLKMERYEDAIRYFKERLEDKPTNTDLLCNIALAYYHLGKNLRAMNYFQQTLKFAEDNYHMQAMVYVHLSHLHRKLGNDEEMEYYKAESFIAMNMMDDDEEEW